MRALRQWLGLLAYSMILGVGSAHAGGVALSPDSEVGFKRFIRMAQEGRFGAGVDNANVSISKLETRIELVRPDEPAKVLKLTPKTGDHSYSRYFDISIGVGAGPNDVAMVGAALDEAFGSDPYRVSGVEVEPGWTPPTWRRAWRDNGWRGLVRASAMRMMMPVSRTYALATTAVLALSMALCCALLWLDGPSE